MQFFRLTALTVFILAGISIPTHAQVVVYNSFGPGDSYNTAIDWAVSGASTSGGYRGQAQAFTPDITGNLSSIMLATYHINGSALSDFYIAQDNGSGAPGSILESFTGTENPDGLLVLNSVDQPLLQAGTQYWLCDEPTTSTSYNGWYYNNQGQNGFAFERLEWSWAPIPDGPAGGVFEVSVMPVPEPGVEAMAVTGGMGLCLVGRRRKQRSAKAF